MSAQDYLKYLDGLDLTKEEKLRVINHVILISGNGGARRDRTADLLHAMQALSQLSYSPDGAAHFTFVSRPCQDVS